MKGDIIKERPPNTSKYKIKYGRTLKDIAAAFGVNTATVFYWLNNPEKKEWLEKKLEEMR